MVYGVGEEGCECVFITSLLPYIVRLDRLQK